MSPNLGTGFQISAHMSPSSNTQPSNLSFFNKIDCYLNKLVTKLPYMVRVFAHRAYIAQHHIIRKASKVKPLGNRGTTIITCLIFQIFRI